MDVAAASSLIIEPDKCGTLRQTLCSSSRTPTDDQIVFDVAEGWATFMSCLDVRPASFARDGM